MFKHKNHPVVDEKTSGEHAQVEDIKAEQPISTSSAKLPKDTSPEALRELLEKNLKWSQIIYEQNRRINSKLFWYDFLSWIRVLLIAIPLILAVIYLPPFIERAWGQYRELLGQVNDISQSGSSGSLEKLLQLLPFDPAKQEQLKSILK
jgi:hypothetical protein